ncbi:MAG: POT family MFS transporter [Planctomycetota bacterium]
MPHATTPPETDKLPAGIPYIVGNEAAERFSFYGMKAILTVFMTKYLVDASGELAPMSAEDAKFWVHTFVAVAYATPVIGAILADRFLGKYRTILWLSVLYCFGHFALAADETRSGLLVGLGLIAFGTGAIKPCVSAHVGDQFGTKNKHLLGKVFGMFYVAINLGAFASTLLTPVLLDRVGPWLAFGVPGVLMAVATFVFWLGRNTFVHIPPRKTGLLEEATGGEGRAAILRLIPLYAFIAVFWCLFDQTASAWVLQAEEMDRDFAGVTWLSSQIQALNPFLILLLVPALNFVVYPAVDRVWTLTPLRKIGLGMFLTAGSFAISALIQAAIDGGGEPNIGWQIAAYFVLTTAEVMVSITGLEFSYTQAPNSLKSVVMALFFLGVAAGNELTALVNALLVDTDGNTLLPGASYYWFFTVLMLVAAVAYVPFAMSYRGRSFIQGDDADVDDTPADG